MDLVFESETFWLSQKRMAELSGADVRTVNEHLKIIFDTNELGRNSVVAKNVHCTSNCQGIPDSLIQTCSGLE